MSRTPPDEERVWLQFAMAALQGMTSIDTFTDDNAVAVDAARLADLMLEKWRGRYPPDPAPVGPATPELRF